MKKLLLVLLLFTQIVFADALPQSEVWESTPELTTIWVVGDADVIARAFDIVAMFFNNGTLMSLFALASLLALVVFLVQLITQKNINLINYFIILIIASILYIPKTSIWISSYYDVKGGLNAGAVGYRKVDNIPVGIAYPLGLFSKIAKSLTSIYDEGFQTLSDTNITGGGVNVQDGGMMLYGAEGFFSPLKNILKLRQAYSGIDSDFLENFAYTAHLCNWKSKVKYLEKGGILEALIFSNDGGFTTWTLPSDKYGRSIETLDIPCKSGGKLLALQMLSNVVDLPYKRYSPATERLALSKNFSLPADHVIENNIIYAHQQKELDNLPAAIANAAGGDTTRSLNIFGANTDDIYDYFGRVRHNYKIDGINWQEPPALAQLFTSRVAVNVAEIEANILFSNIVRTCMAGSYSDCVKQSYVMNEAKNRASVDATGEAGLFQTFMGHVMNLLLFVYIVMAPLVIFLVLIMGWAGWKILSSYLLFAAWINSWLPLMNAIAYYMLQSYTNSLHQLVLSISSSEEPYKIYSPVFIQNILDSTRDMLSSASTMMSAVPLIMLSILSGSIYGMVALAQRASMTQKDFVDEDKIAPKLDESPAIGTDQMLSNSSTAGPVTSETFHERVFSNADANNPGVIKASVSKSVGEAYQDIISDNKSFAQELSQSKLTAEIGTDNIVTKSGTIATESKNGDVTIQHVEQGDNIKDFANNNKLVMGFKANAGIEGSGGLKILGSGAIWNASTGAHINKDWDWKHSDSAIYKDSDGNIHKVSQGDNLTEIKGGIETSHGHISQKQLQEAFTQKQSEVQSNINSLTKMANSVQQSSFSVDLTARSFASLVDPYHGTNQMQSAANVAQQYDQGAYNKLMQNSNSVAGYYKTLQALSTGSTSEKMAALSAIGQISKDSNPGISQEINNMLGEYQQAKNLSYGVNQAIIPMHKTGFEQHKQNIQDNFNQHKANALQQIEQTKQKLNIEKATKEAEEKIARTKKKLN